MEFNQVAAKWFADKLRNISPENFNNGDIVNSFGRKTAELTANLALEHQFSEKQIKKFEEELANFIAFSVREKGKLILTVDYAPDSNLNRIASKCGIKQNFFPWKTTMKITADKVTVKSGLISPIEIIYPY